MLGVAGRVRAAPGTRARLPEVRHRAADPVPAAYVSGVHHRYGTGPGPDGSPTRDGVLDFGTRYVAPAIEPDEPDVADRDAEVGESLLDILVDRLVGKGLPAHQVWLPPLAESPTLDQLLPGLVTGPDAGLTPAGLPTRGTLRARIGLVDQPVGAAARPAGGRPVRRRRARGRGRRPAERQVDRAALADLQPGAHPHAGRGAVLLPRLRRRHARRAARAAARRRRRRPAGHRPGAPHRRPRCGSCSRAASGLRRRTASSSIAAYRQARRRRPDHRRPVRRRVPGRRRLVHDPHRLRGPGSGRSPTSPPAASPTAST